MAIAFAEGVAELDAGEARVIVVSGAEGHFCAGANLTAGASLLQASDDQIEAHISRDMHGGIKALAACRTPTLAAIRGACAGFGLSIAMACDLRLATTDARFSLAFTRIGLHPDGGSSWLLPRLVGPGVALELMLLAERFDGFRAQALGLVNRAVEPDRFEAHVDDWADRLASGPPIAMALAKANVAFAATATLEQTLDREARTQVQCLRSADAARGVAAFFAKEAPTFEGD